MPRSRSRDRKRRSRSRKRSRSGERRSRRRSWDSDSDNDRRDYRRKHKKYRRRSPSDEPYSPTAAHNGETEERLLLTKIGDLLKNNLAEEALALQQQGTKSWQPTSSANNESTEIYVKCTYKKCKNPSSEEMEIDESSFSEELKAFITKKLQTESDKLRVEIEQETLQRIMNARQDECVKTRERVLAELKDEVENSKRQENESKARCERMERRLEEQLKAADDAKCKLDAERLEMLNHKRRFEEESNRLKKKLEENTKKEQGEILNKGGNKRAPLKFSLGAK